MLNAFSSAKVYATSVPKVLIDSLSGSYNILSYSCPCLIQILGRRVQLWSEHEQTIRGHKENEKPTKSFQSERKDNQNI